MIFYVCQDGKLYRQVEDNKLVGVEIYSDKVLLVEGYDTVFKDGMLLTPQEVRCQYHIDTTPYIFPREEKKEEVVKNDTVKPTKRTTRKSTSK